VIPSLTKFSIGLNEILRVLLGFDCILPFFLVQLRSTRLYRVLLGFTGFSRVLMGLDMFQRDPMGFFLPDFL